MGPGEARLADLALLPFGTSSHHPKYHRGGRGVPPGARDVDIDDEPARTSVWILQSFTGQYCAYRCYCMMYRIGFWFAFVCLESTKKWAEWMSIYKPISVKYVLSWPPRIAYITPLLRVSPWWFTSSRGYCRCHWQLMMSVGHGHASGQEMRPEKTWKQLDIGDMRKQREVEKNRRLC